MNIFIINLRRDEVELSNGAPSMREVIEHPGGVTVAALTDENELLFVRQFRYPYGEVILEIPAGKLDTPDEDPTSAVIRELREETGAKCERLTFLGMYYPSPAILSEKIGMYVATGLHKGAQELDEDEFLDVVKVPFGEVVKMIMENKIPDAKTQTAVLKAKILLGK